LGYTLSPNSKILLEYILKPLLGYLHLPHSGPVCEGEIRTMWSPLVVASSAVVLIAALRVGD